MNNNVNILFTPLVMPNLTLKNRFFMAPMGTGFGLDRFIDYLVARARGGVTMITIGDISVHPSGRAGILNEPHLETDDDIKSLVPVVNAVKKAGAKVVAQLSHLGRYAHSSKIGQQSIGPSAIASRYTGETPRAISTSEAEEIVQAFTDASLRTQEAGFAGIEFSANSGYLISQFLSPLTNKRTDKYGGDLSKRSRFLVEILSETRKAVGPGMNLCVKFDAEDGMEGGKTLEDSKKMVPEFAKAGADRLHVWAGWHESSRPMLPMFVPRAAFVYMAQEIKSVVDIPVATVGRINDPFIAAHIIAEGKADMIGLGRALLCDPEFVKKAMEGRADEIRRCIACCHCFDSVTKFLRKGEGHGLECGLNPELGREGDQPIKPAKRRKSVLIIGSGPAGMEAARVAALRGHKVDIYEERDRLGGLINIAAIPPHKKELDNIIDYYQSRLSKLCVVKHFNESLSAEEIRRIGPDVTILATGAEPLIPDIEGCHQCNIVTAQQALAGTPIPAAKKVVVIGGGMVGIETAEYLAKMGCAVTVIEMTRKIAFDMGATTRWGTIERIRKKMKLIVSEKVVRIRKDGVMTRNEKEEECWYPADLIVMAAGYRSHNVLEQHLKENKIPHVSIGSGRRAGTITEAIREGYETGCKI